jgi:hypothetical protein
MKVVRTLQLKWSDETKWKNFKVADERPDEVQLAEVEASWRASRGLHGLRHDAAFRIVTTEVFCDTCQSFQPALPQVGGQCVWCARRAGVIDGEQLANYERMGWANGLPTLPHTFRQDAIDK